MIFEILVDFFKIQVFWTFRGVDLYYFSQLQYMKLTGISFQAYI